MDVGGCAWQLLGRRRRQRRQWAHFRRVAVWPTKAMATIKSFYPTTKTKCAFEKECVATDALVQIGGMLLDAVQILHDSHKVRRRQLYGPPDALVWPKPKPNAKRKLSF